MPFFDNYRKGYLSVYEDQVNELSLLQARLNSVMAVETFPLRLQQATSQGQLNLQSLEHAKELGVLQHQANLADAENSALMKGVELTQNILAADIRKKNITMVDEALQLPSNPGLDATGMEELTQLQQQKGSLDHQYRGGSKLLEDTADSYQDKRQELLSQISGFRTSGDADNEATNQAQLDSLDQEHQGYIDRVAEIKAEMDAADGRINELSRSNQAPAPAVTRLMELEERLRQTDPEAAAIAKMRLDQLAARSIDDPEGRNLKAINGHKNASRIRQLDDQRSMLPSSLQDAHDQATAGMRKTLQDNTRDIGEDAYAQWAQSVPKMIQFEAERAQGAISGGAAKGGEAAGRDLPQGLASLAMNTELMFRELSTMDTVLSDKSFNPASMTRDFQEFLINKKLPSDPNSQRFVTSAKRYLGALLQMRSGAAVSDEEIARNYTAFFPQQGDASIVIDDKRKALNDFAGAALRVLPAWKRQEITEVTGYGTGGQPPGGAGQSPPVDLPEMKFKIPSGGEVSILRNPQGGYLRPDGREIEEFNPATQSGLIQRLQPNDLWLDSSTGKLNIGPPSSTGATPQTTPAPAAAPPVETTPQTDPTPTAAAAQPSVDIRRIVRGPTFSATGMTRENPFVGYPSKPGKRRVSLDYNDSGKAEPTKPLIVYPYDATEEEILMSNKAATMAQAFFKKHGHDVGGGITKSRHENGRGKAGVFHVELFNGHDKKALKIIEQNPAEFAQLLADSLGNLPGVLFHAPHGESDQGSEAAGESEVSFARRVIIPNLIALAEKKA